MIDRSQMMRGTLEGCIMKIIGDEETYGYEIIARLITFGFSDAKEGTIYPILMRLEKKNLISAEFKESPLGPKRKYYQLTSEGKAFLKAFIEAWQEVKCSVDRILEGDLS